MVRRKKGCGKEEELCKQQSEGSHNTESVLKYQTIEVDTEKNMPVTTPTSCLFYVPFASIMPPNPSSPYPMAP